MPVTPTGFEIQTTDNFELLLEQAAFGAGVNTSSTSVGGHHYCHTFTRHSRDSQSNVARSNHSGLQPEHAQPLR